MSLCRCACAVGVDTYIRMYIHTVVEPQTIKEYAMYSYDDSGQQCEPCRRCEQLRLIRTAAAEFRRRAELCRRCEHRRLIRTAVSYPAGVRIHTGKCRSQLQTKGTIHQRTRANALTAMFGNWRSIAARRCEFVETEEQSLAFGTGLRSNHRRMGRKRAPRRHRPCRIS